MQYIVFIGVAVQLYGVFIYGRETLAGRIKPNRVSWFLWSVAPFIATFLEENLVDEIYLDIEPIVFGEGIPIFRNKNFERRLKLLGTKQITNQEVQIHYQVIK